MGEQHLPTRAAALELLEQRLSNLALRQHSLATEAIARALARRLGEDEDLWGLTGLLHDLDLDVVGDDMQRHARVAAEWLQAMDFPPAGVDAILRHNEAQGLPRSTRLDHGLAAAEQLTGMIRTTALVQPSRKVADVKLKSVVKRMKDKRFAAAVDREAIAECRLLGLELDEFVQLSIEAMTTAADEIGL